jgi:hypothetical protein
MTPSDIVAYRLSHQRLIGARITAASEVVRWLGAVQAQDYYGGKWAIGLRSSATDAAIEQAFNAGAICDLKYRLTASGRKSFNRTGANGCIPTLEPPNGRKEKNGKHPLAGSAEFRVSAAKALYARE